MSSETVTVAQSDLEAILNYAWTNKADDRTYPAYRRLRETLDAVLPAPVSEEGNDAA